MTNSIAFLLGIKGFSFTFDGHDLADENDSNRLQLFPYFYMCLAHRYNMYVYMYERR